MDFVLLDESKLLFSDFPEEKLFSVAKNVGKLLVEKGLRISLAESCTGGLIAKTLTDVPGSSKFFELGMVTYSDRIKEEALGVDKATVDDYSVVSAQVAAEMALRILRVASADVGVSVTGVAGPGADGVHPEGEIYIGIASADRCAVLQLMTGTDDERTFNRNLATLNALHLAEMLLEGKLFERGDLYGK